MGLLRLRREQRRRRHCERELARARSPLPEARIALVATAVVIKHTWLLVLATWFRPRFAISFATLKRGRREDRVRAAPAVSCALGNKKMRTRADRFGGNTPAFPAQWFDGLCRALPGDRLFDTIAPKRCEPPGNLTPALGASGPHGFAGASSRRTSARFRARRRGQRPPQPAPTFVTFASAPLAGQDGRIEPLICDEKQALF